MYTSSRRMGEEGLTLCGVLTKECRSLTLCIKWSMEIKLSSQCRGEFLSRMDHSRMGTVKNSSLLHLAPWGIYLKSIIRKMHLAVKILELTQLYFSLLGMMGEKMRQIASKVSFP